MLCRETQLRSFYSTTEEIQVLFAKQQEQLKSMQRTLEDEENYDNTSVEMDGVIGGISGREKDDGYHSQNDAKAGSTTSAQKVNIDQVETSSNDASVTEKHDCDIRSEECQNTQEAEFTSADHEHSVRGGYGYKIDGIGTGDVLEKDAAVGTEKVLETESPTNQGEQNIDLNKCLGGDTMQIDDDDNNVQETEELAHIPSREGLHHHQSNNPLDTQKTIEDTEVEGTITTADLLTSEVAGSWACSTAPSIHEENESLRSRDTNEGSGALHDSNVVVAESQTTLSDAAVARQNARRELSEMIGIVAPDLREQFGGSAYDCDQERKDGGCSSDSDTESCSNTSMDNVADAKGGLISDDETQVSYHDEEDKKKGDTMDEDDEDTQED
ncbi:uncharacterized protein LOC124847894 isoform X2 [Vigna umbellata]|uniref:uncharacterized protein LOC124847894 isoform X2 n=1 Tax=Vigna umbellata TaxID=87088 RepID=UPI001F5FE86A|nr:uncharacterized protein LOC124847894 isoform X2 [Vigna umbellata]